MKRKISKRYFDSKNLRIIHNAQHIKWHKNRNLFDEDCGWCLEEKRIEIKNGFFQH